jgi:MFS family permease
MLTDCYRKEEATRVQGANDFILFSVAGSGSLLSGWIFDVYGWHLLIYIVSGLMGFNVLLLLIAKCCTSTEEFQTLPDCLTGRTTEVSNTISPFKLGAMCFRQHLSSTTMQDGTPITFNLPVLASSLDAHYFVWHLKNGSTVKPGCATLKPANEGNEGQTVLLVGDAGHADGPGIASIEVVGPLMLVNATGGHVPAMGLSYSGPDLTDYSQGLYLLTVYI